MKKFSLDCFSLMYSKKTTSIIILVIAVVTFACSSALYVPAANQETASASLSELQAGRKLYVQKCGGCHALFLPEKYTKAEWNHWMIEMETKAKIDTLEKEKILKYLNKGR